MAPALPGLRSPSSLMPFSFFSSTRSPALASGNWSGVSAVGTSRNSWTVSRESFRTLNVTRPGGTSPRSRRMTCAPPASFVIETVMTVGAAACTEAELASARARAASAAPARPATGDENSAVCMAAPRLLDAGPPPCGYGPASRTRRSEDYSRQSQGPQRPRRSARAWRSASRSGCGASGAARAKPPPTRSDAEILAAEHTAIRASLGRVAGHLAAVERGTETGGLGTAGPGHAGEADRGAADAERGGVHDLGRAADGGRGLCRRCRLEAVGGAHEVAPDLRRQAAAGDVAHRRVVVVADPHAHDRVGGEADEPGVAVVLRGPGLAGGRPVVGGVRPRAGADGGEQEVERLLARPGRRRVRGGLAGVEGLAARAADRADGEGLDAGAVGRDGGVGAGHLEQRDARGAERQARVGAERGGDAEAAREVDDPLRADALQELGRHRVDRLGEGLAQRDLAAEAAVRVLGLPAVDVDRLVDHDRVRRHAGLERRQVDEELEQRARLAARLGGAAELALGVVAAADHGQHRPVRRHGDQRRLADAALLPLPRQPVLDDPLGGGLEVGVERGLQRELGGDRAQEAARLVGGPVGEVAPAGVGVGLDREGRRVGDRVLGRGLVEPAGLDHGVKDRPGTGARLGEVAGRRVGRGRLDEARQHGGLGQRELPGRLAEVAAGGPLDAVGPGAEIGRVQVALEDLPLAQSGVQPQREAGFLELAAEGPLLGEEEQLGELLRDGAAALADAACGEVGERRAQDPARVEARMVEEAAVLDRDHRVGRVGRQNPRAGHGRRGSCRAWRRPGRRRPRAGATAAGPPAPRRAAAGSWRRR